MKFFFLPTLLFLVIPAMGQETGSVSKNDLVGTWKLVSDTETTRTGEVRDAFGWKNPTGLLTYTADGRVMVIITSGGRKPLSISDSVGAPAQERAEAFATMTAYAGTYALDGDKVVHHLEVCALPNRVNTELVRLITKLDRKSLALRTVNLGIVTADNQIAYREVVWERISK